MDDLYMLALSDQETRCADFIAAHPENNIVVNRHAFFAQTDELLISNGSLLALADLV